jgi:hypothetical protein
LHLRPIRHECGSVVAGRSGPVRPGAAPTSGEADAHCRSAPTDRRTFDRLAERHGARKVRDREIARNRIGFAHRCAAVNLRRLITLGLGRDNNWPSRAQQRAQADKDGTTRRAQPPGAVDLRRLCASDDREGVIDRVECSLMTSHGSRHRAAVVGRRGRSRCATTPTWSTVAGLARVVSRGCARRIGTSIASSSAVANDHSPTKVRSTGSRGSVRERDHV